MPNGKKPKVINCPSCGAKNDSSARRCGSCGATIEELSAALNAFKTTTGIAMNTYALPASNLDFARQAQTVPEPAAPSTSSEVRTYRDASADSTGVSHARPSGQRSASRPAFGSESVE